MTRIERVPDGTKNPFLRATFATTRREFGRMVDPVGVYARSPGLLFGYAMLERATLQQHRVDQRLKALAELKAGAMVRCEFCLDIGSALAREAGITEEQLLALPRYRDSELFGELDKLVIDYAVGMSRTPADVSGALFDALRVHFDERQLLELTNVIAVENMRARFNTALDMNPAGFSAGMVCALPEPAEAAPANGAPAPANANAT
jgi:AhpD family alkylhydroperoxidase